MTKLFERAAKSLLSRSFPRLSPAVRDHWLAVGTTGLDEAAYRRLAEKGFRPAAIIDVGAYHGEWTRRAKGVFPGAPVLMIEGQPQKKARLEAVCQSLTEVDYRLAVLSRVSGETRTFFEMETGSSLMPEVSNVDRSPRTVQTVTLDEVVSAIIPHASPLFMKLDVQGAEIEVLDGGEATIGRCEFVQLEVALLAYNEGAPTFLDVNRYMNARGFVPFDIAGVIRRGGNLVQMDLLFARHDSSFRPSYFNF